MRAGIIVSLISFFIALTTGQSVDVLIRPTTWPSALLPADVQGTVLVHTISVETVLQQLDEQETWRPGRSPVLYIRWMLEIVDYWQSFDLTFSRCSDRGRWGSSREHKTLKSGKIVCRLQPEAAAVEWN